MDNDFSKTPKSKPSQSLKRSASVHDPRYLQAIKAFEKIEAELKPVDNARKSLRIPAEISGLKKQH